MLLLERKVLPAFAGRKIARVLHVAPERGIEHMLRRAAGEHYVSADLAAGRAMVALDLTALPYPDKYFDFVFVSHVLEHIPDDCRAIDEIHRVLTDGGAAYVEVPVLRSETYEDPGVAPEDRLREFGQSDHVRVCGLDYAARLESSGFVVEPLWIEKEFSPEEIRRMRLRIALPPDFKQAMFAAYEDHFNVSWLCRKTREAA